MGKNAIYKQNFIIDNSYNIEAVLTSNVEKIKNYWNDKYQDNLGLVTERDTLNWRKKMLVIFLACVSSVGILATFFFFFEIPWYIDIAKTKSEAQIMSFVACVLMVVFLANWLIMMNYVYHRFRKVFNARWSYINNLMQNGVIKDFNNLPKAIQSGMYFNDPQGFKKNLGGFYRSFNYFRFIRSVAIFHDKLEKYVKEV